MQKTRLHKKRGNPLFGTPGYRPGVLFKKGNKISPGTGVTGKIFTLRAAAARIATIEDAEKIVRQWIKDSNDKNYNIRSESRVTLITYCLGGKPKDQVEVEATIKTLSDDEIVQRIDKLLGL